MPIELELALTPRNADHIPGLLHDLKDPASPLYGRYLTPAQYRAEFGRTPNEISEVVAYAQRHNLSVVEIKPNNLFVRVRGTVADVNAAFGIHLQNHISTEAEDLGRTYHVPDREPTIDSDVAPLIANVLGLDNAGVLHTDMRQKVVAGPTALNVTPTANSSTVYGTGVGGALAPHDVHTIYGLAGLGSDNPQPGADEVLGLVEFGTYDKYDITAWLGYYNQPSVSMSVVSVDGYDTSSTPGQFQGEFELDCDMIITFAPYASLEIFENTDKGQSSLAGEVQLSTDEFIAMANASTLPNVISDSYGIDEDKESQADVQSECEAIQQLVIQGQTLCVAAGDQGAHADEKNSTPNQSDPGTQPLIVSVGGTDLTADEDSNGYPAYVSETSWFDSSDTSRGTIGTGGGGGISAFWPIQDYQSDAFSTKVNTQGSTKMRNTPDVSLFGDFDVGGYSVYETNPSTGKGNWYSSNGTSAAAPLWAGLLAVVDTYRYSNGLAQLGQANYDIYSVAEGSDYPEDFHDIKDGSSNGYYKAVTGYDNSTGWGSPNDGFDLLDDLIEGPTSASFGFSVPSATVVGGKTLTVTVALEYPAYQNTKFTVASSDAKDFTVPSSVTIDKGKSSATFTLTALPQDSATSATLSVYDVAYEEDLAITIDPATVSSLSLSPTSVSGGNTSTGTVTLNGTAGSKGVVVDLKSSNTSDATVPSSVTVASGKSSATFTVSTKTVASNSSVTIMATGGSVSKTATLAITASSSSTPSLSSVSLSSTSVVEGKTSTGTVTLSAEAPSSGVVVTLKSSDTADATVPSTVTVASGKTSATFTVTSKTVTKSTSCTITATGGSVSKTATLSITTTSTSSPSLSALSVSPTSVAEGKTATGTVTLSSAAPSSGTAVTLKSSDTGDATVPSSVTVASGKTTATFTVTSKTVSHSTSCTITATNGSVSKTASLSITT